MAQDLNNVTLIGRFAREPELKQTSTGKAILNFSLAVNKRGESGPNWIDCIAWEKSAELIAKFMHKGSKIGITGSIDQSQFTDKENKKQSRFQVVVNGFFFLDSKSESKADAPQQPTIEQQFANDNEIPF